MRHWTRELDGKILRFQAHPRRFQLTLRGGTVHAFHPTGTRRQSLRAWWGYVVSACVLTSCVVLPPTADPPAAVPPIVQIQKTTPLAYTPFVILDPNSNTPPTFSIDSVFTQSVDPAALHYYWYYDWDVSQSVLDAAAVCQDHPNCSIFVCNLPKNALAEHRLLAVVSSTAQLAGAVTPTDFPPATVWDAIEWRIEVTGSCP